MKKILTAGTTLGILAAYGACEPRTEAEARSAAPASAEVTAQGNAEVAVRYLTAPTGNAARYRIREQLVGLDLPNDAIGETSAVTGAIAADAKGASSPAHRGSQLT